MGTIVTSVDAELELSAVVTRADGTVEDLGVIARTPKRSRLRRLLACIGL